MSDNRDFDLRNLPAIAEMLASGVPESMDLSTRIEELERERDEARQVARQLTRWAPKNIRAEMQSYPWLTEEPGSEKQR